MNRLIVTHYKDHILSALLSGKEVLELSLADEKPELGNIYIGKVNRVVKNLNSAFVDYAPGKTGYYSLTDNPVALLASGEKKRPAAGDELIVQVAKEAVRTKDPVLSSDLSLAGKYAVLTPMDPTIGFSARITDKAWKESVRQQLSGLLNGRMGVIVRTNAYHEEERLFSETTALVSLAESIIKKASTRTCYSLLYEAEPDYVRSIKNAPGDSLGEIVTDDEEIARTIEDCLSSLGEDKSRLRFYDDKQVGLDRLYSLDAAVKQATQKRVWLKSGGYLVVEPTEAMVVIDVNTGKYSAGLNPDAAIRKINREAAGEICHQLRLRNLSGIIMIDFIDMKSEEDRQNLLAELKDRASEDPVKTTVVDITPLGLVELTRKKERRPFYEQLAAISREKS